MKFVWRVLFCLSFIAIRTQAASPGPWQIDANANLTTGVNAYSDNWVGGEAGSFTWLSQFMGVAERQLTLKVNTKTTLKLQFGQTETQDKQTKYWSVPQKSTDLIDGEELLRFTLGAWADPFFSVRAISQFLDNRDSLLTRYLNPLEITEALGASRTLVKSATVEWSSRLGFADRQLIDRHHLDTATGKRKTDVTNDGGIELDLDLKAANKEKWITFISSLRLYEALFSSNADKLKGTPDENSWRQPHLKWENTLTLTFAKYLMLNLSAYAYYDRDIAKSMRLKETMTAGLTYIFSKK